jgi:hypothetical protein
VRLASLNDQIHGRGAEVIAVSGDDDVRQAGMYSRWPTPNIRYVSDPDGQRILRPLGLFDPEERGGIGRPAMLVLDPDGVEVYRYVGRDFADRTTDDAVLAAVAELGLDPIEAPSGGPVGVVPDDLSGFFATASLLPYFRGNRFAAVAISRRVSDADAHAVAIEHRDMCDATIDAWRAVTSPH